MAQQQPDSRSQTIVFSLEANSLGQSLTAALNGQPGQFDSRAFPDGESYLRIVTAVDQRPCIVIANLAHPNEKYLPLLFLLETLRELGASSVGLVAPYLCYMRQDRRFIDGEAITSRIFARSISNHIDWLVTVDPHLHRYQSLDEIYTVPSRVVQGAPALAQWLKQQSNLVLIGPDSESEQWVAEIARYSGHPFFIGSKQRLGDRQVEITLPQIPQYHNHTATIIDDVISSGQTILQCTKALRKQGLKKIQCAAVHGLFADGVDRGLMTAGLESLITTNTIAHSSNKIDITSLLVEPIKHHTNLVSTSTTEEQ